MSALRLLLVLLAVPAALAPSLRASAPPVDPDRDRSPIDLLLTDDERWLVVANQTAGTLSLVSTTDGAVAQEIACGERPGALAFAKNDRTILAVATYSGDLVTYERRDGSLKETGRIHLGFEPTSIVADPTGRYAYISLAAKDAIALVDLQAGRIESSISVGRLPGALALTADGRQLAVALEGDLGIAVVDTEARERRFLEDFQGINFGQMRASPDGRYAYVPWMVYRRNPITASNIRQGWVLASRVARVRLDEHRRREAISLDPRGAAVSDPFGIDLSADGRRMVVTASGTHELLVFRSSDLPWRDYGGPGDHIDADLLADKDRFFRIPLGGRPMAVRLTKDARRAFVANYLDNSVQEVDLEARRVARSFFMGGPKEPSLARQGETLFLDGRRSLDQWYSCQSCHRDGRAAAVAMDTKNDGSSFTFKSVPSLWGVTRTGPWMWHATRTDLADSIESSFTETMLGPPPTAAEVEAIRQYLATLPRPPNPFRELAETREAAARGEVLFREKGRCARCHPPPDFTDGKLHDVGTGSEQDAYDGYNPPSLVGVYARPVLLHDGQVRSLEELLGGPSGPHRPSRVSNTADLTGEELADLVAYLRTL